jgi:hypothetical protein
MGDISFCPGEFMNQIINAIEARNLARPDLTYYFQSKNPAYFAPYVTRLPRNVILVTTLETNRDEGYARLSRAPSPSARYRDFAALEYPRKVVTLEPIMDFDLPILLDWIERLHPETIWVGFNSRPRQVTFPEPTVQKVQQFVDALKARGAHVRPRCDTRGVLI